MKTVTARGIDFGVYDRGEALPLLFVHGFPLDHRMWHGQLDAFSAAFRVIAPDLRGFGASRLSTGSDKVQAGSIEQFADDLDALLSVLGVDEPVVFCGLSMGGYIAWQFWRKYQSRVRALVLCDTRSGADTPEAAAVRNKMAEHVMRHGTSMVADAMLPKLFSPQSLETRIDAVAAVKETILATDPAAIAAGQRAMAARADMQEMLGRIQVPVLLVVGEEDSLTTVDIMRSDAEAIPGAELAVIPGAGHMAPLEQPQAVNKVLERFLASLA